MTDKQKEFVLGLKSACNTHEDWLTLIRFGLLTLLKDQLFLIELILQEAKELASEGEISEAEYVQRIFLQLELKITPDNA